MADFKQYTSSELTGHFQTPLPLFMGHRLMDDLLSAVNNVLRGELWRRQETDHSINHQNK
jgi:hypothetical protein